MASERFSFSQPDWPEFLFHMQRYALAARFAKDKEVLDCACGEGYGSAYLASTARSVIGVDIAADVIETCRTAYDLPNCSFKVGSAAKLPFDARSFDVVACFETLEHVSQEEQEACISEFRRVLKPNGILLISTPDRVTSAARGYSNPYHIRELSIEEFKSILGAHFSNCTLYSQELNMASALWQMEERTSRNSTTWVDQCEVIRPGIVNSRSGNIGFYYMLAVCSSAKIKTPDPHIFTSFNREPAEALWSTIDKLKSQASISTQREASQADALARQAQTLLMAEREHFSSQFSILRERVDVLHSYEERIYSRRAEIHAMELQQLERQLLDERLSLEQRSAAIARLELAAQDREALLTRLEAELASQVAESGALQARTAELESSLAELEQQRTGWTNHLKRQDSIIEQLEISERNAAKLQGAIDAKARETVVANDRIQDLQARAEAAEQRAIAALAETERQGKRWAGHSAQDFAIEQLEISERNAAKLQGTIEARAKDVVVANDKVRDLQARVELAEQRAVSARAELGDIVRTHRALVATSQSFREDRDRWLDRAWHEAAWRKILQSAHDERRQVSESMPLLGRRRRASSKADADELDYRVVKYSGLFSPEFYLDTYPDVARENIDPVEHYRVFGGRERREPGPAFAAGDYLRRYTDVANDGQNPVIHFFRFGFLEGRRQSNQHVVRAQFQG